MSLKDLFKSKAEKVNLKVSKATIGDFVSGSEAESGKQIASFFEDQEFVMPPVDYTDPSSFARFGSAKKYYADAFTYISDTYPYDGSGYEKTQWHLTASNLDNWIYDNRYPKTTGYAVFSPNTDAKTVNTTDGYKNPALDEYISFFGGPHKDRENKKLKDMFPSANGTANIYKVSQGRESNLKFDLADDGVTVEFWLKKPPLSNTTTGYKEVVFDLWNQATASVGGTYRKDYGRLRIEITGATANAAPFLVTAISGSRGFHGAPMGGTAASPALGVSKITDNKWGHYAFTFKNNGSAIDVELYKNGQLYQTLTTGSALQAVTGAMKATIGALVTVPSGTVASGITVAGSRPTTNMLGWGKLSGSLDEFRFWKIKRNAKQIGYNWFTQVNGGTNTDLANVDLGVYYKFNEGILDTGSANAKVLDYSGRVSNGTWTGYQTAGTTYTFESRNTGSAIDDAGYSEEKDPIIYKSHSEYNSQRSAIIKSGSVWDVQNASNYYSMMPAWVFEDEQKRKSTLLEDLLQVVTTYMDEVSTYITHLPDIRHVSYPSSSAKPASFSNRLLSSYGFKYDDLFTAATMVEEISNKNHNKKFEKKLYDIKNLLYSNIFNNLTEIYKAKGTYGAFRNLLHCLGLDDETIRINAYANDINYKIRNNVISTNVYSRLVDFNRVDRWTGTVYQYTSSANAVDSEAVSYISGTFAALKTADPKWDKRYPFYENEGLAWTFEAEAVFPKNPDNVYGVSTQTFQQHHYHFLTSSIFGMHTAQTHWPEDLTWASKDYANFQVYSIKENQNSNNAKFILTGTQWGALELASPLTSSWYKDVYSGDKWNFAVRVKPSQYPLATVIPGTSGSYARNKTNYDVEFYGVSTVGGVIQNSFFVTSSVKRSKIRNFLASPKRMYAGAHYTNFTSSLRERSNIRIKSVRAWTDYLPNETINAHARDTENLGTENPYRSKNLFNAVLQNQNVPSMANLALHWRFDNVTGSNASGQFYVTDYSSGSSAISDRYGWLSNIVGNQHPARGDKFPVSDNNCIDVDWVPTLKQLPFENINSDDTVNILDKTDDLIYTRDSRPINYFYTIEKSMYQTISDEMIKYFATIKDFNNIIGEPVNRYRQEYKDMGKLRQLFFEKVGNTPDLDRFVNYYKWFDHAVGSMLENLVPASAKFNTSVNNVVESHALERNKYWNKFPTIDAKPADPEGSIKGVGELAYNWKYGHAPAGYISSLALSFASGSKNTISVPDADKLSFGNGTKDSPVSFSFWIRFDDWTSWDEEGTILRKNSEYNVYVTAGKEFNFRLRDYSAGAVYQYAKISSGVFNGLITNKKWHHIVCTYDGRGGNNANAGMKVYVDGVDRTTGRASAGTYVSMENQGNDLYFMSSIGSQDYIDGRLDEVGIWHKELNVNQVGEIYNSGYAYDLKKSSVAGRLGNYYRLGDGGDTIGSGSILDSGVFGYNGTTHKAAAGSNIGIVARDARVGHGRGDTRNNCLWWNERAERSQASWDSTLEPDRDSILKVTTTDLSGSSYVARRLSKPYRFVMDNLNVVREGNKKYENKKRDLIKSLTAYGSTGSVGIASGSLKDIKSCADEVRPAALKKIKLSYAASASVGRGPSKTNDLGAFKAEQVTPFTIFSGSARGYSKDLNTLKVGAEFNNMHIDTYDNMHAPLQGPFTEKYVGGYQHRHVDLNYHNPTSKTGSTQTNNLDSYLNRPEAYHIDYSTDTTIVTIHGQDYADRKNVKAHQLPRATLRRDEFAKRPVNIRNIKMTSLSPTKMGNYSNAYEYFQTTGRDVNNLWFRSGSSGRGGFDQPTSLETAISGTVDFMVPNRERLEDGSRNKTVFVERFSAPGGPETMGKGFLDTVSEMYSVYNALPWRNATVRSYLNEWESHHIIKASTGNGFDATYGQFTASFHKTPANRSFTLKIGDNGRFITSSVFDNAFIQRPIPSSDRNYAWITASLAEGNPLDQAPSGYAHQSGLISSSNGAEVSAFNWLTASEHGSFRGSYLSADSRLFGADRHQVGKRYTSIGYVSETGSMVYTDFVGINSNFYEPLTASQNFLGYPTLRYKNRVGLDLIVTPNVINSTFVAGYNPSGGDPDNTLRPSDDPSYKIWRSLHGYPSILNGLILHRQGPYGWPSWKQIRGGRHPLARNFRKNNVISYTDLAGDRQTQHFTESAVSINYPLTHNLTIKTPNPNATTDVAIKHSWQNLQERFESTKLRNKIGMKRRYRFDTVYDKLKYYYNAEKTDEHGNMVLKDIPEASNPVKEFISLVYKDLVFPTYENIYSNRARTREQYIVNFWRNKRTERTQTNVANSMTPNNRTDGVAKLSMWPLDGGEYSGSFTSRKNMPLVELGGTGGTTWKTRHTGAVGELQNQTTIFWITSKSEHSASALYSRPIEGTLDIQWNGNTNQPGTYPSSSIKVFGGDAAWEAGVSSSIGTGSSQDSTYADRAGAPFYESYKDYSDDLRAMGKGYSIVPEFRISEHMDEYVNKRGGDFLAELPGFLTLTGAALPGPYGGDPTSPDFPSFKGFSDSRNPDFYKIYSTTDFLRFFDVIEADHPDHRPSQLTLQCKVLKKFLPYDGFYPAQRTLQLAQIFSQSYGDNIAYDAKTAADTTIRPIIAPLFAPGILFNSIKSGMAVDYPVFIKQPGYAGFTRKLTNSNNGLPLILDNYAKKGKRLPFETLIEPEFHFNEDYIYDAEVHPSAAMNVTASLGNGNPTYKMAMHNFLAEVPKFFLKNRKMTTLISNDDKKYFNVESFVNNDGESQAKEYKMRVVVSHALFRQKESIYDKSLTVYDGSGTPSLNTLTFSSASWAINPPTVTMYNRYSSDAVTRRTGKGYDGQIPIQNFRYGSSFGPPVSTRPLDGSSNETILIQQRDGAGLPTDGQHEYTPFTPPYYDGYSEIELSFAPQDGAGQYDLNQIWSQTTASYRRLMTSTRNFNRDLVVSKPDYASNNAMQLSSSLIGNDGKGVLVDIKDVEYGPEGVPSLIKDGSAQAWVFQLKWESPFLDFTAAKPTFESHSAGVLTSTGSIPLGLWHQYGKQKNLGNITVVDPVTKKPRTVKQKQRGLKMQIQDVPNSALFDHTTTGSLADLVGFKKDPVDIGTVAEERTISEAIVAIPFTINQTTKQMDFFSLNANLWKDIIFPKGNAGPGPVPQIDAGASYLDLAKKMQRYVIPPHFDFLVNNDTIDPFAMYIFEFYHQFTHDDLVNIWQNLPPASLTKVPQLARSKSTLAHPLLENEFFGKNKNGETRKFNSKVQWLIFKVKQRAEKNYYKMTLDASDDDRYQFRFKSGTKDSEKTTSPDYSYNWPYDFFSMIEMMQMRAAVTISPDRDMQGGLNMGAAGADLEAQGTDFDAINDPSQGKGLGTNPMEDAQGNPLNTSDQLEKAKKAIEDLNNSGVGEKFTQGNPFFDDD